MIVLLILVVLKFFFNVEFIDLYIIFILVLLVIFSIFICYVLVYKNMWLVLVNVVIFVFFFDDVRLIIVLFCSLIIWIRSWLTLLVVVCIKVILFCFSW